MAASGVSMGFPDYNTRPIELLIPYARNSRTHSEAQISKIAASIREFGFLNPVIVDGDNGIIAGHGRILAAQRLGMESVPTVEASHLTEAQKRAYIIADNRLALDAGWDDEMLRVEFDDLLEMGFDLDLTGFGVDEIENLSDDPIDITEIEGENTYNFTINCSSEMEYENVCKFVGKQKRAKYEDFERAWSNR
jgi:hypothetical protein